MANNGNRQGNVTQRMSDNEALTGHQVLMNVMAELEARRDEIAHVLPRDVSFDTFVVSINQALRNSPRLLKCTGASLINACVKAAYDGLKIDGKEAAIVDAKESYKVGSVWKERVVARYMPMVFGLIKQILQSGLVLDIKATVVYAAEEATGRFKLLEGTSPGIHHEPILHGEKGPMIGAYSIALLKNGARTFEWMDAAAIVDVRKEAKTDKVWDRWPTEMWKKTVIRRHRKTLPSTKDVEIRDMEAREMFPQFDRETPHPQFAETGGARPTRAAFALTDQQGTHSGAPLDLGGEGEMVEQTNDNRGEQQQTQQQSTAHQQEEPEVQLPEDPAAWRGWAEDVENSFEQAENADVLDEAWRRHLPIMEHADKGTRDHLTGLYTDRLADIAGDAASAVQS